MKKSFGPNTLIFPTPVWCVGSYDADGRPNIMTIAWGGICCSKPPAVTISLRKSRYTYDNIMRTGAYTLSVPGDAHAAAADFFGMASGRKTDKFKAAGLTPVRSDIVNAPYVDEFPMVLACKVIHTFDIGAHTQFVGEILDVMVDASALNADGKPDIEKIRPLIFSPEVSLYHTVGRQIGDAFSMGKVLIPARD